ncbi:hypothetical protein [Nocardia heshunensis]
MHVESRIMRRIAWAATTVALSSTIIGLSAPTATAHIPSPEIDDCSTGFCAVPASYIVGHTYSFDADYSLDNPTSTNFYADGQCLGSITYPHAGRNAVPWVPTTAGTHVLTLKENLPFPWAGPPAGTFTVTVLAAPPGSPVPQPPPPQGNCVSSGSGSLLGSGSAGLPGSS